MTDPVQILKDTSDQILEAAEAFEDCGDRMDWLIANHRKVLPSDLVPEVLRDRFASRPRLIDAFVVALKLYDFDIEGWIDSLIQYEKTAELGRK